MSTVLVLSIHEIISPENYKFFKVHGTTDLPCTTKKPPIAEQLKAAQKEAQEHRAPDGPKKKAPDRGDR